MTHMTKKRAYPICVSLFHGGSTRTLKICEYIIRVNSSPPPPIEKHVRAVLIKHAAFNAIWGAHQQTSERAAPTVSVEEKGKATGDKRKMLLFLLMSIQY
jgi:hypothetical protein